MTLPAGLIPAIRTALGPRGVLTERDEMAPHMVDWRGAHRGRAAAVLRPASTEEVAAAVRLCHEAGVAMVPQGGNTGLCGGAVPSAAGDEVVISLGRMRRIRDVDPVEDTLTAEAGVVLRSVQEAAVAVGRLFPLSLGSEGSCTVGGNLATNAGGTAVLRYGMARDLVLGLEVVLADGRVWDGLRPLRKDNTGYDLTGLFVGSEGTLGVITAAVLKLFPATPRRATAWLAMRDVSAAVELLGLLREHAGEQVTAWELMSRQALDLVLTHVPGNRDPFVASYPWYGLVELAGPSTAVELHDTLEAVLGAAFERGLLVDAVVAGNGAQRAALWALREGVSEAQNPEGPSLKHDVTVPIGRLPGFLEASRRELQALLPGVRLVTYGHVGDGNLHHNLSGPVGMAAAEFLARADLLTEALHDSVHRVGGSISAEHGLGTAKRDAAAAYKSDVELSLMRALKDALDPAGLMNPGKVLPPM